MRHHACARDGGDVVRITWLTDSFSSSAPNVLDELWDLRTLNGLDPDDSVMATTVFREQTGKVVWTSSTNDGSHVLETMLTIRQIDELSVHVAFRIQPAYQSFQVRLILVGLLDRRASGQKQIADELIAVRLGKEVTRNLSGNQQHQGGRKERIRQSNRYPSGLDTHKAQLGEGAVTGRRRFRGLFYALELVSSARRARCGRSCRRRAVAAGSRLNYPRYRAVYCHRQRKSKEFELIVRVPY